MVYNNSSTNSNNKNQFATLAYPYKANSEGMQYVICYDGLTTGTGGAFVRTAVEDIEENYNDLSGVGVKGYRSLNFNDRLPITVYDSSKKGDSQVYAGGVNDIVTYQEAGKDVTKVVVHTYNSAYHLPRAIFVIK